MKRVTGIGGIFFKANDPAALQSWYKRHLGIDVQPWGGAAFTWTDDEGKPVGGTTAWSIVSAQSDQFAPGTATFMVNYRVEDLRKSLTRRRLQRSREGRRFGVRKVCVGDRSGRKQDRALATSSRRMIQSVQYRPEMNGEVT
jgi:hypothetical protein